MVMYSGCLLLSPGNLNGGQLKINKLDIYFDFIWDLIFFLVWGIFMLQEVVEKILGQYTM